MAGVALLRQVLRARGSCLKPVHSGPPLGLAAVPPAASALLLILTASGLNGTGGCGPLAGAPEDLRTVRRAEDMLWRCFPVLSVYTITQGDKVWYDVSTCIATVPRFHNSELACCWEQTREELQQYISNPVLLDHHCCLQRSATSCCWEQIREELQQDVSNPVLLDHYCCLHRSATSATVVSRGGKPAHRKVCCLACCAWSHRRNNAALRTLYCCNLHIIHGLSSGLSCS